MSSVQYLAAALAAGVLLLLIVVFTSLRVAAGSQATLQSPSARRQGESRRLTAKRDLLLAFNGLLLCVVGAAVLFRPIPVGADPKEPTPQSTIQIHSLQLTHFVSGRDCQNRFPFDREDPSERDSKRQEWEDFQARWRDAVAKTAWDIDRLAAQGSVVAVLVTAGHDIVPLESDERRVYESNQTLAHVRASCVVAGLRQESAFLARNPNVPIIPMPAGARAVPEIAPQAGLPVRYRESQTDRTPWVYVWSASAVTRE